MIENQKINLTKIEFNLLTIFIKSLNRVFKRDEILDLVWGDDTYVTDRTIDVHINSIRKKLSKYRTIIETVIGVGYIAKKYTN